VTVSPASSKKLALDQESLQKLLAAAYTLQENKTVLQAGNSEQGSVAVFSEIAALRWQILASSDSAEHPHNAGPKAPAEAAVLIAHCLRRLTKADGASVCLIGGGYLRPTAYSGRAAKVSGGSVASNSLVATERLRNGRAFQSANACSDIRLGPSLCINQQVGSLLAFPIERQNEIAGLIEVRWTKDNAFNDGDERICQLMADLMREVLEGEDGRVNARVTHPVQATAACKQIPETTASVSQPETRDRELSSSPAIADTQVAGSDLICRVCGKSLNADLNFCVNCGMLSSSPENDLQGKWASMWFMQQAQKTVETEEARGERLWPLNAENSQNANARIDSLTQSRSDDIETSSESKRNPSRVLAVLKSRFRARAMGQ